MSSESLCLARPRSAMLTVRRAAQSFSRCPSSWASQVSLAPCCSAISPSRASSPKTASGTLPSTSARTQAPVPGGKLKPLPSTAFTARSSISSRVRGSTPAASTALTARAAARTSAKTRSAVCTSRGSGSSCSGDLGRDAQRALAADEQPDQVVAGHALDGAPADPEHLAVGHHPFHPQHVVAGDAVLERARAAGVLGDVAAERAPLPGVGIRRVEEALRLDRLHQIAGDHPGLDHRDEVLGGDRPDGVHPLDAEDDASVDRHRPAALPAPRPARRHRDAVLRGRSSAPARPRRSSRGSTTRSAGIVPRSDSSRP